MSQSVQTVIDWLHLNPTELVILYVSHFDGDGDPLASEVANSTENVLLALDVDTIREFQCSQLQDLTVGGAKERSVLTSGGHLLAVFECMTEQYDSAIECYYNGNDCTNDEFNSPPFVLFDSYMSSNSRFPSASDVTNGRVWMTQAHWQYDLGSLLSSPSIIADEQDSMLNNR
jgi:hypothetical protein